MAFIENQSSLQKLMLSGKSYRFNKGQILQSSDDQLRISMVKSGFVKRYLISNEGVQSIQIIYGAGDIFPLTHVFKLLLHQELYTGNEVFYYETLSETEVLMLDDELLVKSIEQDPVLYRDLLSVAGSHMHSMLQGMENTSLHTSYQKVAHLLAVYASQFGVKTSVGVKIKLPITHQLLANVLNITRETVSQSIIQLRKKKLLSTNKYILVADIGKLFEESSSGL